VGQDFWTDERVTALREYHAAGHSARQIAALMGGVSRNTIIGKQNRLGLPTRKSTHATNDWWTAEREAELRRLHDAGYSAAKIAQIMGATSRDAIIGKRRRLGLSAPLLKQPRAARSRGGERHVRDRISKGVPAFKREQEKLRCVDVDALSLNHTTAEVTGCEYIKGDDHLHCGHPKMEGSSYCTPHHYLCWVPARPRTETYFVRGRAA
jgi:GcrA cell cycle regulator